MQENTSALACADSGFSIVEVLLAAALFAMLVVALVGAYLYGEEATALAGDRVQATFYAQEGLEAARNIRDADFSGLMIGTYGLATTSGQWALAGSSDTLGIFTRALTITSIDASHKAVACTVSWQQNAQRAGSVTLTTHLANWLASAPTTCQAYALSQGYASGTCRQNTQQCSHNHETHLSAGDAYCTAGPSADTCCAHL